MDLQKEQKIMDLIADGYSHRTIAKEFGCSTSTVSRIRNKKPPEETKKHPKPDFTRKPKQKIDPVKMLEQAADRVKNHNTDKDYQKIAVDTKKPIAVMKAADLHFGGLDIDYFSLAMHVKFLMNTPNFYLQLFGDDVNMMVMHKVAGARHDGWTPEEQVNWLESWVDEMTERGKLLSMASGNHSDEFTERTAGFGIIRMLMKKKIPYFRGMGYIDLKVGKYQYPMGFAHKSRFNSFMNPVHGNKRMEQMHSEFFGADKAIAREYITAHTHNPAFGHHGCIPSERIYYIKCGTFKTNCLFSQRYFGQGRIGVPTVVYHPDRFEHICFPTPFEAYRYMNGTDWTKA